MLIAAYLASKLARESDKYTFGDEKKGRRKRSRGGHDAQTADVPSSGPADASLLYAPRSFHLERLLTIFKHIYETNHRMDEEEADTTHTAAVFPIVKSHHSFADSGRMLMLDGDERFIAMVRNMTHSMAIVCNIVYIFNFICNFFSDMPIISDKYAGALEFYHSFGVMARRPAGILLRCG